MNRAMQFRVGVFAVTVLALAFNIWFFRSRTSESSRKSQQKVVIPDAIPPAGFYPHDMRGKPIGNPQKTIADMHLLFAKMLIYKKRHGAYPKTVREILDDMEASPSVYGVKNAVAASNLFKNQDMKNHDVFFQMPQPENTIPYMQMSRRPDGTARGGAKAPGTRDVLTYTDMYFHRNAGMMPGRKWTEDRTGFYLVLWEDGEVQQIPYEQIRFVFPQRGDQGECFPGQAGTPSQTYSREEYYKLIDTKSSHIYH